MKDPINSEVELMKKASVRNLRKENLNKSDKKLS